MIGIASVLRVVLAAVALCAAGACSSPPKSYATPQDGVDALVSAATAHDAARFREVMGSKGTELIRTDDPVADRADIDRFLALYQERHSLSENADGSKTLLVGHDDWPMPVPLVQSAQGWHFDAAAGAAEVRARRIGRNELSCVDVCGAIVDAQQEYAGRGYGGTAGAYAQRFISQPGTRNGLYWPDAAGEPMSPLGPLLASASAEGYALDGSRPDHLGPASYHGYRYRILTAQGPHAPGGARNYVDNGAMTGGFAVVAAPAEYGNTGIMTFLLARDGVLYEADLGNGSTHEFMTMHSFDPDQRWQVVVPAR